MQFQVLQLNIELDHIYSYLDDMIHRTMEILNDSKKKLIDLFINRNHNSAYIHLGKYYQAKEFIDIVDFYYNLKKGDKKRCQL